jgi:hypothetical protein
VGCNVHRRALPVEVTGHTSLRFHEVSLADSSNTGGVGQHGKWCAAFATYKSKCASLPPRRSGQTSMNFTRELGNKMNTLAWATLH